MPLLQKFEALSYRLFGRFAPYFQEHIYPIKGSLEKGRVRIFHDTYISMMFLTVLITLPISVVGIVLTLLTHVLPLLVLVPVPAFIVVGFLFMPTSNASDRASAWSVRCLLQQRTSALWLQAALRHTPVLSVFLMLT